ncbi:MAG TPA: NADH-quinone oxidoreductase subunit J [Ktedonobacterales bacterium]|jgi:NADH-quinone oxidoreductase subunit J|nr:NADH-quinone oxidoreductase subunit J [Ktedonobacterales bacterium]
MLGNQIAFYVLAVVALASALGVVLFRNAVYCMLSLIVNLLSLAFFFLLLEAIFIATIQVLIYAGAVMVLFLFVVTMLAPETSALETRTRLRWQWAAGGGLGVILAGALIFALVNGSLSADAHAAGLNGLAEQLALPGSGNIETFGQALFHGFSLPFEITSALLVVAVLGAVVLGRRASRS